MVKILNNILDSPIYIFSGGKGLSANSLVQSILVQFPESKIPVKIVPDITDKESLEKGMQEVSRSGGIIVHTVVDREISDLNQVFSIK
jgi:regulator of PEP synthase PpsR (kinase-PPPase family)